MMKNGRVKRNSPVATVRGKSRLKQALEAVVGLWKNRRDIDPVEWQREIRNEWKRS